MIERATIEKLFPQLQDGTHYLDSAASSLTPEAVLSAMDEYYRHHRANIHRGIYKESVDASMLYDAARAKVADMICAKHDEVIFTSGATAASNMFVRMLEESGMMKSGGNIVTSIMEHHATLVPLQQLALRKGMEVRFIEMKNGVLDLSSLDRLIDENTAIVSVMLVSNVLGTINPIKEIRERARACRALMLTDATAALGHIAVDVQDLDVDALWFSGHKMFGPTGVGALWVKEDLLARLSPSVFGGDMVVKVTKTEAQWAPIPTRFEAGTPNIAGVIGLSPAIDLIGSIGIGEIHQHNALLASSLAEELRGLSNVTVHSSHKDAQNVGTVAFSIAGVHSHDIAQVLADRKIAVRAGHHCAMPLHTALGVSATTRASFHIYNAKADVAALLHAVKHVITIFA